MALQPTKFIGKTIDCRHSNYSTFFPLFRSPKIHQFHIEIETECASTCMKVEKHMN